MDVDSNQPLGTPTWMGLGVPDLACAGVLRRVFGWPSSSAGLRGPEQYGRDTTCLLRGRPVAARSAQSDPSVGVFRNVYPATPDCDRTAERARAAGDGSVPVSSSRTKPVAAAGCSSASSPAAART